MRGKGRDNVSMETGDCLSKMPTATAEQLNIAKMLSKPGDDIDLRSYVAQLQELTECTEDQAVTALYDCENNLERAVELLLDKFRCGNEEEWHTTGRRTKSKNAPVDSDTVVADARSDKGHPNEDARKSITPSNDSVVLDSKEFRQTNSAKGGRTEAWSGAPRRDTRNRKSAGSNKTAGATISDRRNDAVMDAVTQPSGGDVTESSKMKTKASFDTDGWDPYTEYGEWTGEAIEVVNSNASIEEWCPEQSNLPPELFVDTEHPGTKDAIAETQETNSAPSMKTETSPSLTNSPEVDSLFVSKAHSKPPPPAFLHLPDVPVFVVPDLLPAPSSRWMFKFGGEPSTPAKATTDASLLPTMKSSKEPTSSCTGLTQPCFSKARSDPESQEFSSYAPPSPSKSPATGFDVNKSNAPRSLLEDPSRPEAKVEQAPSTYAAAHFQNVAAVPKTTTAFPSSNKNQSPATFESNGGNNQSTFLEPSFKNYLLDGLSTDVNKLSVGESTNSSVKSSQFNLQQPVSQGPQTQSSFSHSQGGSAAALPSQISKAPLSHISAYNTLHSSQQPAASSAAQSQQQSVTLPPGVPHFFSQFGPSAYHMLNLSGNSSNPPALVDLDQLQLIQQQRILYDMQLQHQAATTAQSLLSSTADSASSGKPSSHVTGSMGHVTAAGAGIRPDMLASAIGHVPQMLAPGHPYFPFPGLVFMNGYTNAFLNQQQHQQQPTGQDTNQSQSSTHCGSPITQPQAQSTGQPQSFSGLKQVNAGVSGYDDLLDMKYGDPSKQVGFKNNSNQPNYGSFQATGSSDSVGAKLSGAHQSGSGPLNQGNFNTTGGGAHTHFPTQFYSPAANSPYFAAAAVAVAAAAAASVQQQQSSVGSGPSTANTNQSNSGGGGGTTSQAGTVGTGASGGSNATGQLHLTGNPAQPLVLGAGGGSLHRPHQRPVMPH